MGGFLFLFLYFFFLSIYIFVVSYKKKKKKRVSRHNEIPFPGGESQGDGERAKEGLVHGSLMFILVHLKSVIKGYSVMERC